jgi:hypothetical protein
MAAATKRKQDQRYVSDPWHEAIDAYLKGRDDTSVAEFVRDLFHIDVSMQDPRRAWD